MEEVDVYLNTDHKNFLHMLDNDATKDDQLFFVFRCTFLFVTENFVLQLSHVGIIFIAKCFRFTNAGGVFDGN